MCDLERARAVLDRAIELPKNEQETWVRGECDGSTAELVLRMLREAGAGESSEETEQTDTPLPERIGGYRVTGLLGKGGMGVVYEAEQEGTWQAVALKVLDSPFPGQEMRKRFEVEAQVLGRLRHPGIAQIYDAGMFEQSGVGRPYFAMELVEGRSIDAYADTHKLGTRDRLELLSRVCEAVEHAHRRGVIHRDLKPSNILVDRSGHPKILDFGVARSNDADIQTTTLRTDVGRLIGTIRYMSPEQASGNPDELDVQSDVYALGVLAYELLVGKPPYDLKNLMIHEAVRVIREESPKPLSAVSRALRGDVETIVAKALEKEKQRRYPSASELASDIERYLRDEPITARPPSTAYQITKFARRHKTLVGGVAATFAVLVGGMVSTTVFAVRAERARLAETLRSAELQLVTEFQTEQLGGIVPYVMGERLRQSIVKAAPPDHRDDLRSILAKVNFTDIGLRSMQDNVLEPARDSIDEDWAERPLLQAQLLSALAEVQASLGVLPVAAQLQSRALELRRQHLGDEHELTLESLDTMGVLVGSQGDLTNAISMLRQALEDRRRVLGDLHKDTLRSQHNLGVALMYNAEIEAAQTRLEEALAGFRHVLGNDDKLTLGAVNSVGEVLLRQGKFAESEPYLREALESRRRVLGDDHPDTLLSVNNMALLLQRQGNGREAEPLIREALAANTRVLGSDHQNTIILVYNLAELLRTQERYAESEPYLREAVESFRRTAGDDHPMTLSAVNGLGALLASQGRFAEAEAQFRIALDGRMRSLPENHPNTVLTTCNLAAAIREQGRLDEAANLGAEALEAGHSAFPPAHWRFGSLYGEYGHTLLAIRDHALAEEHALASYRIYLDSLGPDAKLTRDSVQLLADVYEAWDEAEPGIGYDLKAAEWRAKLGGSEDGGAASAETTDQLDGP